MPTPPVFRENWKWYRRLRWVAWVSLGLTLLSFALLFVDAISTDVSGVAAGALSFLTLAVYQMVAYWRCPRCEQRGLNVLTAKWAIPWRECRHCGQRKFDDWDSNAGRPVDMLSPNDRSD